MTLRIQSTVFLMVTAIAPVGLHSYANEIDSEVGPILREVCYTCHNEVDVSGELDLSELLQEGGTLKQAGLLGQIKWQIENDEMPPKEATQLSPLKRSKLLDWIDKTETKLADQQAGDPGPIILRRLSNHEYNYTVEDLTGVKGLAPTKDFPVDGAAGEGFTNVGSALVMSPGLLNKYLDAAKMIADHAVMLPSRIAFSQSTSRADWTQEKLQAIRQIYARYSIAGNSNSQNLQGVQFSTVDAGVIPLSIYLKRLASQFDSNPVGETATEQHSEVQVSGKYLSLLQSAATSQKPSILIADFQKQLQRAGDRNIDGLVDWIHTWQKSLWSFGKVGHIGKRDGPSTWQSPVTPTATALAINTTLHRANTNQPTTTLRMVTHEAGDGPEGDTVLWKNATITTEKGFKIPLSDSENVFNIAADIRSEHFKKTSDYLTLVQGLIDSGREVVMEKAASQGLEPSIALAWLNLIKSMRKTQRPAGHLAEKLTDVGGYSEILGWGRDLPTLLVNQSTNDLSFSTLRVPGRGVTIHPTPKIAAVIHWSSPIDGTIKVNGLVADMDAVCGNGVDWSVDWTNELGTVNLAKGSINNGEQKSFMISDLLEVKEGDLVQLTVFPMDENHSCDTTQVALTIGQVGADNKTWDLSEDIVDRIHEGNPLSDRHGNRDVWHFCRDADIQQIASAIDPDSTLARQIRESNDAPQLNWESAQQSLLFPGSKAEQRTADALSSLTGPFPWLEMALAKTKASPMPIKQHASSVMEYEIPNEVIEKANFTANVAILPNPDGEGSVQIQVVTHPVLPEKSLLAGNVIPASQTTGTSWTGSQPVMVSDLPVLVHPKGPAAVRIQNAIDDFQKLFPPALCYTRIVPVDEVVTLTLMHREDIELQNLMLTGEETRELNQHWEELWFVSRHAYRQRDAFDQLWQYATQDADPSAFEPMRIPIEEAVKLYEKALPAIEQAQLKQVIDLADRVWRQPTGEKKKKELTNLYTRFREQGLKHEPSIRQLIARLFVAPDFLYRLEINHKPASTANQINQRPIRPVSDWELANRLSYFLWSSCPDDELYQVAQRGELKDPKQLIAQTKRMIQDPKIRRLATEFGCQWLGVRNLEISDKKSHRHFPTFRDLRADMQEEVTRFWIHLLQNQQSPLKLISSEMTFVNSSLAEHYGIDDNEPTWHPIHGVKQIGRGGVLGFAATLAQQSGASRSSPILRGHWISETLLGEQLPKPPKDVPPLPETPPQGLTERELTAQHSSDPACSRCHRHIDPFGFALESFDPIGRLRTDRDTRAILADGTKINGISELQSYLLNQRGEEFLTQFSRKLLGYAIGRSVQLSDRPLIEFMVNELGPKTTGTIEDAIITIVQSTQFTHAREE